ncbi:MAG: ATP-binding cassette domain-containing protein [Bdellovibrionales bacterium]|nr:ATP-binding cassette domain-containing protein [Bdellovibrionales bacterium]
MLQISNLSKSYGHQVLFEQVDFTVHAGERVGIVGRNGHGKSTLFRILLGEESYDTGSIKVPKDYRIGHLSQHLVFEKPTVLDEACLGLKVQEGGWVETYKAEAVLLGLGFSEDDLKKSPQMLSGGFQIRLNLAKLLVSSPNLLLLDEPTNYLDLPSVRWLARFLTQWEHEVMIITHDRGFMDRVTTHTMAIHRKKVKKIRGNTTKLYNQIEQEEIIHEQTRVNQEKKREKTEEFINRFRYKASKATQVQSKIKMLEKMGTLDALEEIQDLSFRFRECPFSGKFVCQIKDLGFGYQKDRRLISDLTFSIGKHDRIGIIGKNGSGKTTLLNLLARELQPTTGEISFSENANLAYFGQTNVDRLDPHKSIEQEVASAAEGHSRTQVRTLCGIMMFSGDAALKKISVLSGGERSRVLLAKVIAQPSNVLFLDEPTNHLDMQSAEELRSAILAFKGAVLFVTHDELLLEEVANRLIVFDNNTVTFFEGGYNDFLRRVGWSGEELEDVQPQDSPSEGLSKKDKRRLRAELQKKRQKLLKPLEMKLTSIEEQIVASEELQEQYQAELIEITKNGYGDDAVKLTRQIAEEKNKVEQLFEELESTTGERDRVAAEIEDQLS